MTRETQAPSLDPTPSPLEERLIALIKSMGPISIADYMADALGHPHHGYYMTGAPIGADGDFTTSPEISQVFGELIGAWLVQSWSEMGEPARFNLVELGPGRGVLMADILRTARLRPGFLSAAELHLVETSGRMRHEQSRRLSGSAPQPNFADEFADIPAAPTLLVANEFFDCLPIRQYQRLAEGWRERRIGVSSDGAALAFTHGPTPPPPDTPLPPAAATAEGAIFEVCDAALALSVEIAKTLAAQGGRALIIDYGHLQSGLGDTLQAVRRHAFWPVLQAPGQADLTAHVDFEALSRAAIEAGAAVFGPTTQGAFLSRLGLDARLERLVVGRSADDATRLREGARRLAAPDAMGEIFKVVCLSAPALPPPAGFA
jgi:NADH dehydrogenase [ubiquinone] 1 alpha subcomplex assembly factor 7